MIQSKRREIRKGEKVSSEWRVQISEEGPKAHVAHGAHTVNVIIEAEGRGRGEKRCNSVRMKCQ